MIHGTKEDTFRTWISFRMFAYVNQAFSLGIYYRVIESIIG